ncbi:MAG: hypothetical protein AAF515_00905 [Pseudomonadota bacterium]
MSHRRAAALHAGPGLGVFYVTGGGSQLLADLLTEPGASATVLEAKVPYATASLTELLGGAPDRSCSPTTAAALATCAWQRARALSAAEPEQRGDLFGFGLTAALATNRPKRGAHRAHLALQTDAATFELSVAFDKSDTDRAREEHALVEAAFALLGEALQTDVGGSTPFDAAIRTATGRPEWREVLTGTRVATPNELAEDGPPKILFSGAFNPLHDGHRRMATFASQRLAAPVAFEICIDNVDKPPLDYAAITARWRQFDAAPLWLTRLPTFIEKARQFPHAHFLVGVDTIVRIAAPRYYASEAAMFAAFDEFAALGTRFLVFGRADERGFLTLTDCELPEPLAQLCDGVSEAEFRLDISSTALRAATQQGDSDDD